MTQPASPARTLDPGLESPCAAYPRITVVTPSYNQGAYLEQTIRSVLSQNYSNLEYMILDGGSTDESVNIINRYESHLAFWRSHKDSGQSEAIQEGFDRATGDIIAWLNSDDWYEPDTLNKVAAIFRNRKDVVFLYGDYYVVRQNGQKILKKKVSCDFKVMAHAYLMIPQPAAFWRREAFEAVGGLDLSLRYIMDYDLFLKMAKRYPSRQFLHLKEPLASFRLHPESKSVANAEKFAQESERVIARVLPPRTPLQMKILKWVYFVKLELMYLFERGYMPLRKDRTKA